MKIRVKDPLAKYSNLGPAMKEIIIASLVMNTLSLALPLSLLQVYDRIIPNTSFGTLIVLVLGVLVAVGLETFLRVARGNIISWMGTKFEHRLGCAAFERVLYAQNQGKNKEGIGDTLERLSSMRSSREYYSGQMVASLVDMPFVFVFLGMVYVLGGPIVWVPVIVLTVFSITSYFYGVNLGKALRRYNLWKDRRLNFQIEILTGIHTIKSMGMESQMEQRYSRLQDSVADADQEMVRQDTSSQHISFIFSQITMVGVAAYGSTYVISHDITVGVLAACTLLSGRAMQPFQRLTGLWSRLQSVLLAREKISGIFDLVVREDRPDCIRKIQNGHILLEDVTFGFGKAPPLLENVNFEIQAGECVGISGGNGVGKSALLGLIRGTHEPTGGQIIIDGVPLANYANAALKGSGIAYLPQNGVVFNGTILENLTMFDRSYRKKALVLAEGLGLNEVVAKMPKGYETIIGNSGMDALPRGIRQRIAIARALVFQPRIILFDEANASIDGPSDVFLREYLINLKGKSTIILVTPRPSLLRIADKTFEISDRSLKKRVLGPVPTTASNAAPKQTENPAITPNGSSTPQQIAGE